ncbi:MAG TPA: TraB/GumN family protein [Puia sp.]|nr:TraB/GumN family protein [Puia sp.]
MKRYLLLAGALLTASVTFSQTPHTLLWRISGKAITRPSYLFGTMHILCADDATLTDSLQHVIRTVDEVYFEIDLSDMTGMIKAFEFMKMNNGKTLEDLLKPADYARVKAYFSSHPSMLPFSMLERFKPMLISGLIEEQSLGCATTDGMEMQIMKAVHQLDHHTPIAGLETAAFQASLFDSIPYTKQAKELVDYLDSADQNKEMSQQLAKLYSNQDLDGIQALSDKDDPGMNEYMDLLLYDRNRKWAGLLDTLLPHKSLLIAVGAGHLPGGQGVIELLRKKGYTVEPVFGTKGQSL